MKYLLSYLIAGSICASVQAQFVPVRAEVFNQMWKIDSDGSKRLTVNESGYFVRSSSGVELRRTTGERDKAEFRNLPERKTYSIDYNRRVVFLNGEIPQGVPMSFKDAKPPPQNRIAGEEMVSGIRCIKVRGTDASRHNLSVVSLDYDLMVRSEMEFTNNLGERFLVINGLKNIQVGVEPDPAELKLPAGFQLLNREGEIGTKSCEACPRPGTPVRK